MEVPSLLLRGGTVIDGTGAPAVRADVRVVGGVVVAVGPDLPHARDERAIDCDGLVVAPGFIDTHSHSDLFLFEDPTLPMKVRQGVTLEVLGQDGISVAPVRPEHRSAVRRALAGLDGDPPAAPWNWESVDDYLGALDGIRPTPNVAYLVPHGALRTYVMGPEDRRPDQEELWAMERELSRALDEGAVGLSTGLIYPPCCYADTEELVALGRVVAAHGAPIVVHLRSESDAILPAIDEMLDVGRRSGAQIHISHFKIAGRNNFHKADAVLARVEAALAAGQLVTADQYPYNAGSTLLGAVLPPWAHDGGTPAVLERLRDPDARARMKAMMLDPAEVTWDNFWKWTGPGGIVVSQVPSGRHPEYLGKSVQECAGDRDPVEFLFDLLLGEEMGVGMVSHSQSEEVVERFARLPYVNVCTDALLGGRPHPRAYGACPRVLGRLTRDRGLFTLEEAVRKLTSQAAHALGLAGVGELRVGFEADVTCFDPKTVADRATFQDPIQYPDGIEHVLIGGRPAVEHGRFVAVAGKGRGRIVGRRPHSHPTPIPPLPPTHA